MMTNKKGAPLKSLSIVGVGSTCTIRRLRLLSADTDLRECEPQTIKCIQQHPRQDMFVSNNMLHVVAPTVRKVINTYAVV